MEPSKTSARTTYAILGQLAWGEAARYELVKAMRRNLRSCGSGPRAESTRRRYSSPTFPEAPRFATKSSRIGIAHH